MSRYDYPDPGTDPAYCDPLADGEPDEAATDRALTITHGAGRCVYRACRCWLASPPLITRASRTVATLIRQRGDDPTHYAPTTIRYWLGQCYTPDRIVREILGLARKLDD